MIEILVDNEKFVLSKESLVNCPDFIVTRLLDSKNTDIKNNYVDFNESKTSFRIDCPLDVIEFLVDKIRNPLGIYSGQEYKDQVLLKEKNHSNDFNNRLILHLMTHQLIKN